MTFEGEFLTKEQIPEALNYTLVLAPIKIEERTSGGILLTTDTKKLEETTRFVCKVLSIGPLAFRHDKFKPHPNAEPIRACEVGDIITISSYAGSKIPMIDPEGRPFSLKVINDDEVLTRIHDGSVLNV